MNGLIGIDLEALRNFIGVLQSFNNELEANWGRLDGTWKILSESWRDLKMEEFSSAVGWEEVRRQMRRYLDASDSYKRFLVGLEEAGTAYQNIH